MKFTKSFYNSSVFQPLVNLSGCGKIALCDVEGVTHNAGENCTGVYYVLGNCDANTPDGGGGGYLPYTAPVGNGGGAALQGNVLKMNGFITTMSFPKQELFGTLPQGTQDAIFNYFVANNFLNGSTGKVSNFLQLIISNNLTSYFTSELTAITINPNIALNINNLFNNVIQNNFSTQSVNYANSFMSSAIANPNLMLDFNLSVKSPAFIDFSSIDVNTPEGAKFTEIYNALITSPTFKNLFVNLFGVSPLFNVKFQIENIPHTSNGDIVSGKCVMINNGSLNPFNMIKIDRTFLLTKSKVDIAQTILHEAIHAFLNIKFRNTNIGMPISTLNNMDIQDCINIYFNGFSGNQTQHNFFVTYMVPTLAQILIEIKDSIITPQQANQMEYPTNGAAILYQPLTNPPTLSISASQVQWNWNVFFNYISYSGLQDCTAYPYSTPLIQSHVFNNNEDYFNYYYIHAFNTIFNP